jgi:hypothetical protein
MPVHTGMQKKILDNYYRLSISLSCTPGKQKTRRIDVICDHYNMTSGSARRNVSANYIKPIPVTYLEYLSPSLIIITLEHT